MTLNIAIVDDDIMTTQLISQQLKTIFNKKGIEIVNSIFNKPEEFLSRVKSSLFHITFLDIEMPNINGIYVADLLNKNDSSTKVIFVTNREDKVFDCFSTHPFGFVRKSHFQDDITKVIDALITSFTQKKDEGFLIQTGNGITKVMISDIMYIESKQHKTIVQLKGIKTPIITNTSVQDIYSSLKIKGFIMPYKGILINCAYISKFDNDEIVLSDDVKLPISRRKYSEVKEAYMEYLNDNPNIII